ncbi:IS3 family transposase [Gardnerella vaginalis]|uniref:IS3 family transposase n=1 Tax=Gardnerella vaginalis TaxID=2702 RepID=UPI0012D8F116
MHPLYWTKPVRRVLRYSFKFKLESEYIDYYNNCRIQKKTKWMTPLRYRMASIC